MRAAGFASPIARPILRESVPEAVARRILEQVTSGALGPGDMLPPERVLAARLGVSRPSLREAIRGLQILGVVRIRQGGGVSVSDLDAEAILGPIRFYLALEETNVRSLYEARGLVESDVARRAAARLAPPALDRLAGILAGQRDTLSDPDAFRESDLAFHEALWAGSGNAYLQRIGASLHAIGLEFRKRASETPGVLEQSLRDHHRMLAALRAGDAAAAAAAAAEHMQNVYRSTVAQSGFGRNSS